MCVQLASYFRGDLMESLPKTKKKTKKSTKIFFDLTYVCVGGGALDVQMYHQNYASYNDEFFYYNSTWM